MDSGSGSMQSSSGGDEEYDSHQQPDLSPPSSLFFNNISPSNLGSIPRPPFHLPHNYQTLQPTFFDFSSNYNLHPNLNQESSLINLDMVRPTGCTIRSELNRTDFKNLTAARSSQTQAPLCGGSPSPAQLRPSVHDTNDPRSSGGLHPKNTKKRTRASRRAPTTVLTTDTSNFRAMVQEFTGIPAPPFSAAGSSYSRRFDLFGSASSALRSTSTHLEPSGSGIYPLRPKVQPLVSFTAPPMLSVVVESAASTSYQLRPTDDHQLGLTKDPQTTSSNMQPASILSFQGNDFSSKQLAQENNNLEHHIHGSGQLLSALQNDESWRGSGAVGRSNNASNINLESGYDIMA